MHPSHPTAREIDAQFRRGVMSEHLTDWWNAWNVIEGEEH
jgi:hypothetical protein